MRRLPALAVATLMLARPVAAQGARGVGPDASVTPAGTIRIGISSDWQYGDQRFSLAPGGGGTLQPLGAPFSLAALGTAQLPRLAPEEVQLRALAADPTFRLSLASTTVSASERIQTTRLRLAAGVTRWLQLDVTVPYVRTRANVVLGANPGGIGGNAGVNPALADAGVFAADTAFANEIQRAATGVAQYCAGSGRGTSACANAGSLAADAAAFGSGLGTVYGGAPYVPIASSAAGAAIAQRATTFRNALNQFAAISGSGVPAVNGTGVTDAAPLAAAQVQQALADTALGAGLAPLQTVQRSHFGDVEAGVTLQLLDTFGDPFRRPVPLHGVHVRVSAGAAYRFATGEETDPPTLLGVGAGTHTAAAIVHAAADVSVGTRLWASIAGRVVLPRSDQTRMRATNGAGVQLYAPLSSAALLARQRGTVREIEVTPRWNIADFLSVGLTYRYTHAGADAYMNGSTSVIPAIVGGGAAMTAQEMGGGIAFSNAHAVALGQARIPIDASFEHLETVRGRNVVKLISDRVLVRVYAPLFGR